MKKIILFIAFATLCSCSNEEKFKYEKPKKVFANGSIFDTVECLDIKEIGRVVLIEPNNIFGQSISGTAVIFVLPDSTIRMEYRSITKVVYGSAEITSFYWDRYQSLTARGDGTEHVIAQNGSYLSMNDEEIFLIPDDRFISAENVFHVLLKWKKIANKRPKKSI